MSPLSVRENQVYILADLHLNLLPKGKRKTLLDFISRVVSTRASSLILNGDIFDMMVPSMSAEARNDIHTFISMIMDLANGGTPVQYVLGNHDLPLLLLFPDFQRDRQFIDVHTDLKPLPIAPNFTLHYRSLIFPYQSKRVYIEHGHIFDLGWVPGLKWMNAWGKAMSISLEKDLEGNIFLLWEIFKDAGEDYNARILRTGSHLPPAIYASREANRLALNPSYDWVVFSHFHAPTIEDFGEGRLYANTGDSLQRANYIVFSNREMRLCNWQETIEVLSDAD